MHICFLTSEYPKKGEAHGGIGTFVKFLAEKLINKGYSITVLGINKKASLEYVIENNIHIYRLPKSKWKFAKFYQHKTRILQKLEGIHKENPVDIVEGSELSFAFFPKKTSYKKLIRLHGGHHFFAIELNKKPAFWRGFQEKKSFKKANFFVAVSNYVGNQTQKYLNLDFKFETIYNTIDVNKFKNSNIKTIKNSLLFIGTICEKKGIKELVKAIPLIKKQIPNVTLKIIGRDWKFKDGSSYKEYLKSFISDNIKENINIIGVVPNNEISKHIEEANVCVFPSHMESFGLTVIESLIMEKVVIASNIKPFKEIKEPNDSLILLENLTPQEIAKKVIYAIQNEDSFKDKKINSRKNILYKFNEDKIVNENIELYQKITKR